MTLDQALLVGLSTLSGVVVFMWTILAAQHKALDAEVIVCRESRALMAAKIATLEQTAAALLFCSHPGCSVRLALEHLEEKRRKGQ